MAHTASRSVVRLVSMTLAFSLLALACSRVPPGGEMAGQVVDPAAVASDGAGLAPFGGETLAGGPGAAGATGTGGVGATGAGGTSGAIGGAATSGGAAGPSASGAAGSPAGPGSGQRAAAGGGAIATGSGPGVEGRTIKIAFHEQLEDCANQDTNPNQQTYDRKKEVLGEWVKFFNQYVLKEHNWKLEYTLVEDGGYFCPERQRAAALKIAKEIRPLATLGVSGSPQGPVVADVVTRAGIMHIGGNWQFQAEERARHPYAWNLGATSEQQVKFMVQWMQKRLKGTKVPDRTTPAEPMVDRVYGVLGLDETTGHALLRTTQDAMKAAGFNIRNSYLVSPDAGVAAQQGASLVAKMREDGVNTLVWATEWGAKTWYIPLTNSMEAQNYLPDIVIGTLGVAFFDQLAARRVWANAKGTSAMSIIALRVAVTPDGGEQQEFAEVNDNGSAFREAWKKLGHNDSPLDGWGGAFGAWVQLAALATGIIHAGDVLNAETVARGIESAGTPGSPNRCTVARFVGRDYKHVPSVDWDSAHDGGADGYTPVYWVNEQTPFGTNGYYESYDNYVFFKSAKQMPARPTHDTGVKGPAVKKQKRTGIRPWTSCSKFPNFPG